MLCIDLEKDLPVPNGHSPPACSKVRVVVGTEIQNPVRSHSLKQPPNTPPKNKHAPFQITSVTDDLGGNSAAILLLSSGFHDPLYTPLFPLTR